MVAVFGAVLSPDFGADPAQVFLAGLAPPLVQHLAPRRRPRRATSSSATT